MARLGMLLVVLPVTVLILAGVGMAADAPAGPPVVLPVDGRLARGFEPPPGPYGRGHRGVDLAARAGVAVGSASAGVVRFAGSVAGTGWVTVDHGGGLETTYGGIVPTVRVNHAVRPGDALGTLTTGRAHLDWGARLHGSYIDPFSLFAGWRIVLVPIDER